ncbi:glutathione transferase GST 23-like isoform X1 [Iris pallida]|uniref:glutathione transferase n=1 Tax=Iris pallida TaxID=29817 RepID=A0AAX6FDS2_IRIPA|nr:glutathione transferase GST 23-like isoform X1 [Iris pallida]
MAGEGEKERVRVFGLWASPFSLRVEWALKLKGVEYEFVNEDFLTNGKSAELLHYNPVTKKIPMLVHGEKALAESLVIVEYIDEVWSDGYPILPKDPYERAQARFWARYAEDQCLPTTYAIYTSPEEEVEAATKAAQQCLSTLEEALKGKKFFGGEKIGFLDIAVGWFPIWFRMIEEIVGVSLVNKESLPLLDAWFDRFLAEELVKGTCPPKEKLYSFNRARREQIISGKIHAKK